MSLINAQGAVFKEWEGLLDACDAHAALLPNSEPLREELRQVLVQSRETKARQEEFEGRRQSATQQLGDLLARGYELARRLRGFVKSQLGTKNELLVQFGTAPIRRPTRSTKASRRTPPPADKPAS